MPSGKDLQDAHNKGERDYAEGKGDHPPVSFIEKVLGASDESNLVYYEGWANAKSQDKK